MPSKQLIIVKQRNLMPSKYNETTVYQYCRNLRLVSEQRGIDPVDMGPDEHKLRLSESELSSGHLKEINRLKGERDELRAQLSNVKHKVCCML